MVYVGMDIHKKTTTFCAMDEDGKLAKRGKVTSDEDSWLGIGNKCWIIRLCPPG